MNTYPPCGSHFLGIVNHNNSDPDVASFQRKWKDNPFAVALVESWQREGIVDWQCWETLLEVYKPRDQQSHEQAKRNSNWLIRAGFVEPADMKKLFSRNRETLAENLEWYCLAGFRRPQEWIALAEANLSGSHVRSLRTAVGPGYDGIVLARLATNGFSAAAVRSARASNRERLVPAPAPLPLPRIFAIGPDNAPVALELRDGWDLRIKNGDARLRARTLTALGAQVPAQRVLDAWDSVLKNHPISVTTLNSLPPALRDDRLIEIARLRAIAPLLGRCQEK